MHAFHSQKWVHGTPRGRPVKPAMMMKTMRSLYTTSILRSSMHPRMCMSTSMRMWWQQGTRQNVYFAPGSSLRQRWIATPSIPREALVGPTSTLSPREVAAVEEQILEALKTVKDPYLHQEDDQGMVGCMSNSLLMLTTHKMSSSPSQATLLVPIWSM